MPGRLYRNFGDGREQTRHHRGLRIDQPKIQCFPYRSVRRSAQDPSKRQPRSRLCDADSSPPERQSAVVALKTDPWSYFRYHDEAYQSEVEPIQENSVKRTILATLIVCFAADAQAISRYTSTSMSCERVQAIIRQEGAAIMRYRSVRNPGLQLYGRFVRDGRYCTVGEAALSTTIPSADRKNCPVHECQNVDFDDPLLIPRGRRH